MSDEEIRKDVERALSLDKAAASDHVPPPWMAIDTSPDPLELWIVTNDASDPRNEYDVFEAPSEGVARFTAEARTLMPRLAEHCSRLLNEKSYYDLLVQTMREQIAALIAAEEAQYETLCEIRDALELEADGDHDLGFLVEGLVASSYMVKEQRDRATTAIRLHRDQHGDDKCWLDDLKLYEVLGDRHVVPDNRVGNKVEMLKNCARFIDNRCAGGHWPTYAELEAQRDAALARAEAAELETNKWRTQE